MGTKAVNCFSDFSLVLGSRCVVGSQEEPVISGGFLLGTPQAARITVSAILSIFQSTLQEGGLDPKLVPVPRFPGDGLLKIISSTSACVFRVVSSLTTLQPEFAFLLVSSASTITRANLPMSRESSSQFCISLGGTTPDSLVSGHDPFGHCTRPMFVNNGGCLNNALIIAYRPERMLVIFQWGEDLAMQGHAS